MAIYTQTVEQVKRDIARSQGGLVAFGTADSGAADAFTDAQLKRFSTDDSLIGKQVELVGGTGSGEAIECSDYVAATGTPKVVPNWTTQPDNTTRYHIYDQTVVTAELLDELIAEAVASISRVRFVAVTNRKLILDDLLSGDGWMEDWTVSTTPDNWVADGNSTVTQETGASKVRFGGSSAKVVSDGTNLGSLTYTVNPHYRQSGISAVGRAWAWTTTASRVDIKVDYGTSVDSSDHGGDSKWEELSTSNVAISDPSKLEFLMQISAGGVVTAYFDRARLISIANLWTYALPSGLQAISEIYVEGTAEEQWRDIIIPPHMYEIDRTDSLLIINRNMFPGFSDRRLLIKGLNSLTVPTALTDTIEVPEYVKAYVRYELLARKRGAEPNQLEFAKRRRDEEYQRARRIPSPKNLHWIER